MTYSKNILILAARLAMGAKLALEHEDPPPHIKKFLENVIKAHELLVEEDRAANL